MAYNSCNNIPGYPFSEFTQELLAVATAKPVEQMIVDVRNNPGGDSEVIRPLLNALPHMGGPAPASA